MVLASPQLQQPLDLSMKITVLCEPRPLSNCVCHCATIFWCLYTNLLVQHCTLQCRWEFALTNWNSPNELNASQRTKFWKDIYHRCGINRWFSASDGWAFVKSRKPRVDVGFSQSAKTSQDQTWTANSTACSCFLCASTFQQKQDTNPCCGCQVSSDWALRGLMCLLPHLPHLPHWIWGPVLYGLTAIVFCTWRKSAVVSWKRTRAWVCNLSLFLADLFHCAFDVQAKSLTTRTWKLKIRRI